MNDVISEEYYDYFVGTKAEVYRRKWKNKNPKKLNLGWNWAAFFFGGFWLLYRRMYKEWLLLLCIIIVLTIVNVFLAFSFRIFRFIDLSNFTNLFVCIFGDSLYQRKAHKVIKKQMDLPENEIVDAVKAKGDVDVTACVLLVFANIIIFFISRFFL